MRYLLLTTNINTKLQNMSQNYEIIVQNYKHQSIISKCVYLLSQNEYFLKWQLMWKMSPVPFVFYVLLSVDASRLHRVNMSLEKHTFLSCLLRIGKSKLSHLKGLVCWYSLVFLSRRKPNPVNKNQLCNQSLICCLACTFFLFCPKTIKTHRK